MKLPSFMRTPRGKKIVATLATAVLTALLSAIVGNQN